MRALSALVAALLLTACSADTPADPVPSGPPVSDLRIGLSEYRLQLSAGTLRPGQVTVTANNAGSTGHDVRLMQDGQVLGQVEVLSPGRDQTISVEVAPGAPVLLDCTVGGHAEAGMTTSIAVAER